jgi:hypothetical protein
MFLESSANWEKGQQHRRKALALSLAGASAQATLVALPTLRPKPEPKNDGIKSARFIKMGCILGRIRNLDFCVFIIKFNGL